MTPTPQPRVETRRSCGTEEIEERREREIGLSFSRLRKKVFRRKAAAACSDVLEPHRRPFPTGVPFFTSSRTRSTKMTMSLSSRTHGSRWLCAQRPRGPLLASSVCFVFLPESEEEEGAKKAGASCEERRVRTERASSDRKRESVQTLSLLALLSLTPLRFTRDEQSRILASRIRRNESKTEQQLGSTGKKWFRQR